MFGMIVFSLGEFTAEETEKHVAFLLTGHFTEALINCSCAECTSSNVLVTATLLVIVSDFRAAPSPLTGATGSASNDTVSSGTSGNSNIDTLGQSGTRTSHHQSLDDEVTYVTNSNSLTIPATTATTTVTLKATTVAAATEVGFLTSEAEGTGETVVVRSSDISGSDESQQLGLMDAYPIGQVTSTYLSYYSINTPEHVTYCGCVAPCTALINNHFLLRPTERKSFCSSN
uniref:Uncharacterized protein n=1 Tax=Setaria digitata TaxID=48799 RepID=A0A915Q3G7_9BILA